jgi:hypothetical protein
VRELCGLDRVAVDISASPDSLPALERWAVEASWQRRPDCA